VTRIIKWSEYSKCKRLSRWQSALGDDVNLMSWDEEKLPRSRADDDEKEMLLLLCRCCSGSIIRQRRKVHKYMFEQAHALGRSGFRRRSPAAASCERALEMVSILGR
jgi:hypothetical protein